MDLWYVREESSLCGLNRDVFEKDEYGMNINAGMYINSLESETSAKVHYLTPRDRPDNEFSISIYRPDYKELHFITIKLTDDEAKHYTFETIRTAGERPTINSIHYFPLGAMTHNRTIALKLYTGVAYAASAVSVYLTLIKNDPLLASMFNTGFILVPSIVSGLIKVNYMGVHSCVLTAVVVFVPLICLLLKKYLPHSILTFLCMLYLPYMFLGSTYPKRWFLPLAVVSIIVLFKKAASSGNGTKSSLLLLSLVWIQLY